MGTWLDLTTGDSFWPVTKGSTYYFEVSVSSARTIDDVRTWLLNEGWQLMSVQAATARQGSWLTWDVIATWNGDTGTVSDRPGVSQYFQRYLWQPAGSNTGGSSTGDTPSASSEPSTVATGDDSAAFVPAMTVEQAAPVIVGGLALGGLLGWLYWSA